MGTIINEEDIIKTFQPNEQRLAKQYALAWKTKEREEEKAFYNYDKAKKLYKVGYTIKEIAEKLRVHKSTVYWWVVKNARPRVGAKKLAQITRIPQSNINGWFYGTNRFGKKPKPRLLHTIDALKKKNLLPLRLNMNQKIRWLARVCGFMFGDGYLGGKLDKFKLSGDIDSLKQLKKGFLKHTREEGKITIKRKTGFIEGRQITGTSTDLEFGSCVLARYLNALGVPKGNKTIAKFEFPYWVKRNKEVLREFCRGLLWTELSAPKISKGTSFGAVRFSMTKRRFVKEHILFLEEIRSELHKFGIETTPIKEFKKDHFGFHIKNNGLNMLKLYEELPPIYCKDKERTFKKAVEKLKEMRKITSYNDFLKKQEEKVKQYHKVMELRDMHGWSDSELPGAKAPSVS